MTLATFTTVQRVNPLSPWQEAWWHTGRHGDGERLRVINLDPEATEESSESLGLR